MSQFLEGNGKVDSDAEHQELPSRLESLSLAQVAGHQIGGIEISTPFDREAANTKSSHATDESFMHNTMEELCRKQSKTRKKYSSTSSVYAEHTLSDPNNDQLIYCIGAVLQAQMFDDYHNRELKSGVQSEFDITIHLSEEYGGERDVIPPDILNHETLNDSDLRELLLMRVVPTVDTLYRYMKYLMVIARYSIECNIIALVYVNRVTVRNQIALTMTNWRGLWLAAVILAQKVWDDRPLKTSAFAKIFPPLTKEVVIAAETSIFRLLEFNATVKPSVYAKYYFELHELYKEITGASQRQREGDWIMTPLSNYEMQKLRNRSKQHSRENAPPGHHSHARSSSAGSSVTTHSSTLSHSSSFIGTTAATASNTNVPASTQSSNVVNGSASAAQTSSDSTSTSAQAVISTPGSRVMMSRTLEDETFRPVGRYVIN